MISLIRCCWIGKWLILTSALSVFVARGEAFAARIISVENASVVKSQGDPDSSADSSFMDRIEETVEPFRRFEYSALVGFGDSGLHGGVTVGYPMGPFVLIDTSAFYARQADPSRGKNNRYGFGADLTLRLANRIASIVPVGGTGIGFERWDQYLTEGVEEPVNGRDDSATVSHFAGLHLKLNDHLQLRWMMRWLTWLDNPPRDLATQLATRLARHERRMEVGVGVIF
jgi:hypothetical protein